MFTTIKKITKWTFIVAGGLFMFSVGLALTTDYDETSVSSYAPESSPRPKMRPAHLEMQSDINNAVKQVVEEVTYSAEDYIAEFHTKCQNSITNRAKFPSEVDHNWFEGNDQRIFDLFDDEGNTRILIRRAGKMMNGLGMMVPFTASCKYNFQPKDKTWSTVEILIN